MISVPTPLKLNGAGIPNHTKPKTPPSNRLCSRCKVIEDNKHFISDCTLYKEKRHMFLCKISNKNPMFPALTTEEKLFIYWNLRTPKYQPGWANSFIISSIIEINISHNYRGLYEECRAWGGRRRRGWMHLPSLALSPVSGAALLIAPVRGFWSWFGGVCSLTYCNGNFRVTMVSEPFNVIL